MLVGNEARLGLAWVSGKGGRIQEGLRPAGWSKLGPTQDSQSSRSAGLGIPGGSGPAGGRAGPGAGRGGGRKRRSGARSGWTPPAQ